MTTEVIGIKVEDMDLKADPGVDFHRYATGGWEDRTVLPASEPTWGAFQMLRDSTDERVRTLIDELKDGTYAKGSNEQKIGDFYFAAMNEEQIEREDVNPIMPLLKRVAAIRTVSHSVAAVAGLHLDGIGVLFSLGAFPDFDNSEVHTAYIAQSGLGLPDPDYYLKDEGNNAAIRAEYKAHIQRMLHLLGLGKRTAPRHAEAVVAFETELARFFMEKADARNPAKINNKMPLSQVEGDLSEFPLRRYLNVLGTPSFENILNMQPNYLKGLNALLAKTPMWQFKAYLRWHVIKDAASALSSRFVNENFAFYGKTLMGQKEQKPRWKNMVEVTNGALGELVGQVYVARYFPPEAKALMKELGDCMIEEFRESISHMPWMSEETRKNALAKVDTFELRVGYPDKWRDYSAFSVRRDSFAANLFAASHFAVRRKLAKIGQPVDRAEWPMTPQTVNAMYNAMKNQQTFPAAILQLPFFDLRAHFAVNCGGICMVIGHEGWHGYDKNGSQFDAQGRLRNWWTPADLAAYTAMTQLLIDQYNSFTIFNGKHLKGENCVGEAGADLGGVTLAYRALQKMIAKNGRTTDAHGFTDEQRFFIAFAQLWSNKQTPERLDWQVTNDEHPPPKFRVNGTLAHMPEFAKAFGLPEDCPMMLPPEKRCKMW